MSLGKRPLGANFIPGLTPEDIQVMRGSWHSAPAPALLSFALAHDGTVSAKWSAKGSSYTPYSIVVSGKIDPTSQDGRLGGRFSVICSCPDGERQACVRNKLSICKHAAAALETVVDRDAAVRKKLQMEEDRKKAVAERERKTKEEAEAKVQQEAEMPGERARIEDGLKRIRPDELKKHIAEAIKSVNGLAAVAAIFHPGIMPERVAKDYCVRCRKHYDSRFAAEAVCKMPHSDECTSTEWQTSKLSWTHCERCDKDFDPDGNHSWSRRHWDDGEFCFVGTHTLDRDLVRDEDWPDRPDLDDDDDEEDDEEDEDEDEDEDDEY